VNTVVTFLRNEKGVTKYNYFKIQVPG